MNVLLIGGTRFVGYLLAWRLVAAGARVTLFNRGTIADPFGDAVERLRGDRTAPGELERAVAGRSFDAVVDFAAYYGEDVRRAVDLFGGARGGRAGHYVFISTGQVYLVREGCPWPAREEDYDGPVMAAAPDPGDHASWDYGIGKRQCEDALTAAFREAGFPGTSIRIPMVNGERDPYRRIEGYLRRILDGGPVLLPDGGTRRARHVYGADVARAIARLLGDRRTFGRAYNLSQDETPTVAEIVTALADLLGAPARLVAVPSDRIPAAGLDPRQVSPFSGRWMSMLDPTLAKRELAFTHEPLRAYLDKIVTSFLAAPPPSAPEGYAGGRAAEIALARSLAS